MVLIDDFNARDTFVNALNCWIGGDDEMPGLCSPTYEKNAKDTLGNSGSSIRLEYNVSDPGSFSYFYVRLVKDGCKDKLDLVSSKYLSFWVKGARGGENFKIELHQDINGNASFDYGTDIVSSVYVTRYSGREGITTEWKKIVVPLADFTAIKDFSEIFEIVLTFEEKNLAGKKGSVYLDDMLFGNVDPNKVNACEDYADPCVKSNGCPINDSFGFERTNDLTVESMPSNVEAVWFQVSEDKRTWKRISVAYDAGDGLFKTTWATENLSGKRGLYFRAVSVSPKGDILPIGSIIENCSIKSFKNNDFIDDLERKAFQYFLDNQNENTGLFRDTAGRGDASIAVTGMGLTALCIGAERGWLKREEARERVLKAVRFFSADGKEAKHKPEKKKEFVEDLLDFETTGAVIKGIVSAATAPVKGVLGISDKEKISKDGFYYHFLDYDTGARAGKSEISTVDTALLLCGLITAGEFFGGDIKQLTDKIYSDMNWLAYQDSKALDGRLLFYMGSIPEKGFLKGRWDYFSDETILVTLLAVGSPSADIPAKVFYDWKRERGCYKGGDPFIYSWYGALFSYQYAHLWFDLKDKSDIEGVDWFKNSERATLANRRFCIDNSKEFKTYAPQVWGISSALIPQGYTMSHGTLPNGDGCAAHDGTVAPLGMAASINFTPFYVLSSLRYLNYKFPKLRGKYGLKNAFNLRDCYYAPSDYGLDLGAFLIAAENFRSGFVWKYFMKNEYMKKAVKKAGFSESYGSSNDSRNGEIISFLDNFIIRGSIDRNYVYRAFELMEDLIGQGDIEAFKLFEKYEEKVYSKIHKWLDLDPGRESAFLRFCVFARQFNFKEADSEFEELMGSIKEERAHFRDKADKIKCYIKKLLSMRMMEGYVHELYREYSGIAGGVADGGFVSGIKELAECAFHNNAYEESASFYGSYFRSAKGDMPQREYTAMCGRIAQRFFSIQKYELASEFDIMKIKRLISTYRGEPSLYNVIEEDMMKYFNAGSYITAKRIADIVILDCREEERGMAFLVRGQCYRKMKMIESAVEDFNSLIDRGDDDELWSRGMLQLGETYMMLGDDRLAQECFNKVINGKCHDDSVECALFNQGLMCYYDNDIPAAKKYFERIIENDGSLCEEARKYLVRIGGK